MHSGERTEWRGGLQRRRCMDLIHHLGRVKADMRLGQRLVHKRHRQLSAVCPTRIDRHRLFMASRSQRGKPFAGQMPPHRIMGIQLLGNQMDRGLDVFVTLTIHARGRLDRIHGIQWRRVRYIQPPCSAGWRLDRPQ